MGRKYRLSKKISTQESKEILHELKEIKGVEQIGFTKDDDCIMVKTSEEKYPDVLGIVVNICKRDVSGLEISFAGFVMP